MEIRVHMETDTATVKNKPEIHTITLRHRNWRCLFVSGSLAFTIFALSKIHRQHGYSKDV